MCQALCWVLGLHNKQVNKQLQHSIVLRSRLGKILVFGNEIGRMGTGVWVEIRGRELIRISAMPRLLG